MGLTTENGDGEYAQQCCMLRNAIYTYCSYVWCIGDCYMCGCRVKEQMTAKGGFVCHISCNKNVRSLSVVDGVCARYIRITIDDISVMWATSEHFVQYSPFSV